MNFTQKHKRILLLLVLLSLSAVLTFRRTTDSLSKQLSQEVIMLMEDGERLIDYASGKNIIYALIERQIAQEKAILLLVFRGKNQTGWIREYEGNLTDKKPWKLEVADVDGDGTKEVLIGVSKTTLQDQRERNRMFIYQYENRVLSKKWTGSEIAGSWRYFYGMDLVPIPGDELIFIEETKQGNEKISIYYWFDFGFFRLAESESYERIEDITILGENRMELTYYKGDVRKKAVLTIVNESLVELGSGKE